MPGRPRRRVGARPARCAPCAWTRTKCSTFERRNARALALRARRSTPGPADGAHLAAASAAAEELIAAVGLEPRHAHASRHIEPLLNFAAVRIDPPQVALVAFPGAVPELAIDPGHAGDDTVGFDGAENFSGLGIDLMDFLAAVLADPERAFRPGEAGIAAIAGRRNRRKHTAGVRIDLVDPVFGDLKQMPAVERRSGVRGDVDRAQRVAARWIERAERVSAGKPDLLAVVGDSIDAVDTGKGSIFPEDFGGGSFHVFILDQFRPSS